MISFDEFVPVAGVPIYLQILRYIQRGAAAGRIQNGDELPSRRVLSALLGVNPNTVQKAYRELEREGYIYTVSGKGSFVAGKSEIKRDPEKVTELLDKVKDAFRGLTLLGYSPEDAASLIQGSVMETLSTATQAED